MRLPLPVEARAGGAELELTEPLDDRTLLTMRVGLQRLRALTGSRVPGEGLAVRIPPGAIHWLSGATGERLEAAAETGEGAGGSRLAPGSPP